MALKWGETNFTWSTINSIVGIGWRRVTAGKGRRAGGNKSHNSLCSKLLPFLSERATIGTSESVRRREDFTHLSRNVFKKETGTRTRRRLVRKIDVWWGQTEAGNETINRTTKTGKESERRKVRWVWGAAVLQTGNTCLQGQSLCVFVVRPPPLSLCNSPSDEMCLKRWIGIGGAVLTWLWGIHLQPSATVMKGGRCGWASRETNREREWERENARQMKRGRNAQTFCSASVPQTHHYPGLWPTLSTRPRALPQNLKVSSGSN